MQEHSSRQHRPLARNGRMQPSGRRAMVCAAARSPLSEIRKYAFLAATVLLALALTILQATAARAQQQGILMPGDAVVTGFAGIKAPDAPVAPGADPLDLFHIDLDGPSAQIFQLGATGAPARGQIISAQTPFKLRARDAGQVFAIALDDALPPNIYVGQTSAFGLQIVGPDANGDGRPDRLKNGQPNAQWMAGQFGTDKGGGPGSIYRIDGRTGAVSLFATIPGNSGTGLGAIVFDRTSRQFFVSDLDSGLIHRLDASGATIDSFDHGTAGRVSAGLDAVADDGRQINIKDPAFDVEEPSTWGFTQPERRVSGMAILLGRLYYAVADEIWSIGIGSDGRLAGDARVEVQVANAPIDSAITKIAFDGEGRMYLAQRGAQRSSYDYSVFAEPLRSSVLRYKREAPADPTLLHANWEPIAEQYAIGLPPDFRNGSGGVALGYGYDESGSIRRGACNRSLWSTGDNLRNSETYAGQLGDEGPLDVHGLQGNDVSLVRPKNEPPLNSYFVDYDGQFGDSEKAGHVGDVEIWQPCHSSHGLGQLTPGYWPNGEWPGFWLPPADRLPTNLRLEKKAIACWPIGGGKHRCGFSIKVTNTGPGLYHDHIQVRDMIPAGTTAIFSSPKFDACPGGPPNHTCTTLAPVHLLPWEQVTIPVRVDVPNNLAKQLDCKVRNRALILHASSPSEQNTDPSDDDDAATAHLPAHLCKDPPKDKNNLRITKHPLACFKIAGNKIRCGYHVRVWNMGPGDYNDKIVVNESIPVGATPTFSGPAFLGWNCVGGNPYACTSNPVFLSPGQNALLVVRLDITQAQAKAMDCKVRNTARITHAPGGSDENTNPADDVAVAIANVPADICDPPIDKTNLRITKLPLGCFKIAGNKIRCGYHVRVVNTGPGTYIDHIKFSDQVPPGTTAIFSSAKFNACPGGPPTYSCSTVAPVILIPGQSVLVVVRVDLSVNLAKQLDCKVRNRAHITFASVGNKNTNAADDFASALAVVPADICDDLPEAAPVSEKCPPGFTWIGDRCSRGPGLVTPPACPDGQWLNKGHCCPVGQIWTGRRCGKPPRPECPDGTTGKWPNCREVEEPKPCPEGTTGKWPNCRKVEEPRYCPEGTTGKWPNCRKVEEPRYCPEGTTGKWPNCRKVEEPKQCPEGTTGKWPNCKRPDPPRCPKGMIGTPPDCKRPDPPKCPTGMIGTPPNCKRPVPPKCPTGMIGTPPNCKRPELPKCPTGMIGTPPNCKRLVPEKCPAGTVGKPPNCRKIPAQTAPTLKRLANPKSSSAQGPR